MQSRMTNKELVWYGTFKVVIRRRDICFVYSRRAKNLTVTLKGLSCGGSSCYSIQTQHKSGISVSGFRVDTATSQEVI